MTLTINPYITEIEKTMLEGCLREDRVSQNKLYSMYKTAMFTTATRIVKDREAAKDVLQDSFIKVFRNISSFRSDSSLGAWIKTIVVRTALEKIRSVCVFESYEQSFKDEVIEWDNDMKGEDLHNAIMELPDGYRTIFSMTEVEGYTHKEVATILNISEGTSKSQLFHAKKLLQKKLSIYATNN